MKQEHEKLMRAICYQIYHADLPLILKGGTALLLCYGLDRHSEDLDFDSNKKINLVPLIKRAAKVSGFSVESLTLLKNTDTVRRYRLNYTSKSQIGKLKIEVSLRDGAYRPDQSTLICGVKTYEKNHLALLKRDALHNRTTARDLHDIIFLAASDKETRLLLASDIKLLYRELDQTFSRFFQVYQDDPLLVDSLLSDLQKLQDCYEALMQLDNDHSEFKSS